MGIWTRLGWPRIQTVDACEYGNEPSSFVK